MVTYHDIRAARLAQNTVHGQTWRGSQMACQFSAENGSGSGGVTAALMLIALDGGSSLDDSFYMLSAFGELKELRREPTRPDVALAEFYDARHAAAALKGIGSAPEAGKRLVAIDAGPSLSNLPPQLSEAAGAPHSWNNNNGNVNNGSSGGMHQSLGSNGDLSAMTQSLQEMMLAGSSNSSSRAGGQQQQQQQQQGRVGMGLPERRAPSSASADLLGGMPMHSGPVYPLRGIQSTGSVALWAQQQAQQAHQQQQQQQQQQLGTSPLGQVGGWGAGNAMQPDILAAQQQQQATAVALLQQNSALLQQQQQQVAQNAAVQAALQQAMLNQQVAAAAALGLQANRRNFSEPTLGGRLARRPMDPMAEAERRAQQERLYGLDMQRIAVGEDKRTTLMVKNIPNKYTQKMLLSLMEERFAGVPFPFDFFYLPIDFKNRCNVGYAFINMTTPHAIPALVEEFHGRRWPKFNSEKICKISYARIQGKNSLVQHFQNSSLLHEDKRCRPVLFGPNGEVEIFPIGDEV